ncbi:hypothetical protein Stsp02_24720 [Streptomyces sp. NBRC 14336]|uniref:hypothetical protein n=1 Tax=Streptomyces sp. NBRC 14336 TaxID=3030992 RepID=UPI0024A11090|nr:hypothetical protein [Streptomyces sp. NBRC 14336]GLW46810.1 hypothetical protein Stsp02_24720 [Streptomyces sp. NBRC 14336]
MELHRRDAGPDRPQRPDEGAGLHIALMGIDGAGKSSIAVELADTLRAGGHEVEIVNFKRAMAGAEPATAQVLSHVAFAALRAQYAEAVPADPATDLGALLAREDDAAKFSEIEDGLRAVDVAANRARPLLSSAVLEIVGGFWVHTYVASRLRDGVVVVNDSFGYKHVLKNVLLAQRLSAPGSPEHTEARRVLDTARTLFHALFGPTLGYWVDTDPRLAVRWRAATGDVTTPFESYGLAGEHGDASFLAMQDHCRDAFREAAHAWQWQTVALTDVPKEQNISGAVRRIEQDALRHLRRAREAR